MTWSPVPYMTIPTDARSRLQIVSLSVKTTLKRLAYPYTLYLELSSPYWHFVPQTVVADKLPPRNRDVKLLWKALALCKVQDKS